MNNDHVLLAVRTPKTFSAEHVFAAEREASSCCLEIFPWASSVSGVALAAFLASSASFISYRTATFVAFCNFLKATDFKASSLENPSDM